MWLYRRVWPARATRAMVLVVVGMLLPWAAFGGGATPNTALAASNLNWKYKGFNIAAYWKDELMQSGPALDQIVAVGGNSVTFAVTWYTDPAYTSIYRKDNTATDESLIWAMDQAHARGLKIILKPHIDIDSNDRSWRAYIDPKDPSAWFKIYTAWMVNFADMAQQHHAEVLTVGAELVTLSTNTSYQSRWRTLFSTVRQHFSGKLTYSANWGGTEQYKEWAHIPFWDALDYMGISAYFPIADNNNSSLAQLTAKWRDAKQNQLLPFQKKWNKPVLFSEVGYRNMDGTAAAPFDWWTNNGPDQQEQADCYEALFATWANTSWFVGTQFWYWDLHPGTTSVNNYPVQDKQAYATVRSWFTAGGTATATPTSTKTTATPSTVTPSSTPSSTPSTATPTSTPTSTPSTTTLETATPTSMPSTATPTNVPETTTPAPAPEAPTEGHGPIPPGMPPTTLSYGVYLPMMSR